MTAQDLTKYTITAADKKCNDGTPYVYYGRRNPASTVYIVWMQGGGFCRAFGTGDTWDCDDRTALQKGSAFYPATLAQTYGILSNNPDENPHFFHANHFYFPHISSDIWTGTDQDVPSTWYFHGKNIAQFIPQELIDNHELGEGDTLIICGDSGGAAGIYHNANDWHTTYFAAGQPLEGVDWYFVPVSGWVMDPGVLDVGNPTFEEIVTDAIALWTCGSPFLADFVGEEYKAFLNDLTWPLLDDAVKARMLVVNAIPDQIPLNFSQIATDLPLPEAEMDMMISIATTMRTQLSKLANVFALSRTSNVDDLLNTLHAMLALPAFMAERYKARNVSWAIHRFIEAEAGATLKLIETWNQQILPSKVQGTGDQQGAVDGGQIDIVQAATLDKTFTGLTYPLDFDSLLFTMKVNSSYPDIAAALQVRWSNPPVGSDGLQTWNGTAVNIANSVGAGIEPDVVNGTLNLVIHHEITERLAAGTGYYDLKVLRSDGTEAILLTGTYRCNLPITRSTG